MNNETETNKNWTQDLDDLTLLAPRKNRTVPKEEPMVTLKEFDLLKKRVATMEKHIDVIRFLKQQGIRINRKIHRIEGDVRTEGDLNGNLGGS